LYFEQYVAVYGWRGEATQRSHASSCLPHLDLSLLMDFYRAHESRRGAQEYQRQKQATMARWKLTRAVEVQRPFELHGRLSWAVRLPDSLPGGDTAAHPTISKLLLFEDGNVMGPPHCEHAVIQKYGGGRFSHWGHDLFFSTSDGSDPNRNGRTYAVALEVEE